MGETHEEEVEELEELEKPWKGPIRILGALFLMLIIIMMVVPYYAVRLDPEPEGIPSLEEMQALVPAEDINETGIAASKNDYLMLLRPNDPVIKLVSDRIVSRACDSNEICHAKALFYFVRDNFDYVMDPTAYEYVKPARLSIVSGAGDCDDASVLLANLLESAGIETRFVFVPRHVFVQARIPKAIRRYKYEEDWINLDPACKSCGFGEITYSVAKKEMDYVG